MKTFVLALFVGLYCCCGELPDSNSPDQSVPVEEPERLADCNMYFIWEIMPSEADKAAVAEACFDFQTLTETPANVIEARLFSTPVIIHSIPGNDQLIEILRAGPTLRVGLSFVDPEVIYLATRGALKELAE